MSNYFQETGPKPLSRAKHQNWSIPHVSMSPGMVVMQDYVFFRTFFPEKAWKSWLWPPSLSNNIQETCPKPLSWAKHQNWTIPHVYILMWMVVLQDYVFFGSFFPEKALKSQLWPSSLSNNIQETGPNPQSRAKHHNLTIPHVSMLP